MNIPTYLPNQKHVFQTQLFCLTYSLSSLVTVEEEGNSEVVIAIYSRVQHPLAGRLHRPPVLLLSPAWGALSRLHHHPGHHAHPPLHPPLLRPPLQAPLLLGQGQDGRKAQIKLSANQTFVGDGEGRSDPRKGSKGGRGSGDGGGGAGLAELAN